jgi:cytochrome c-type biogenesis protein
VSTSTGFSAGYEVASIACTIAVLLAVVGQALAAGSFLRRFRFLLPLIEPLASVLLILSGASLAASGRSEGPRPVDAAPRCCG